MKKIVLTGASGRLGSRLRGMLAAKADVLVSTDIRKPDFELLANEKFVAADLSDFKAMRDIIDGAEMVVHFGAIVDDGPFDELLGPNFIGSYNVWEAAYQTGARRVVYASSIHAVGLYPKTEFIDNSVPHRPDSFYGLSKCFTEDLGKMYWEKRNLESVHLRIYSCAEVNNARMLGSWLSYNDLIHLVERSVDSVITGFTICYGVSNNDRVTVDNSNASFLGYCPKDNAEQYAKEILANEPEQDPTDPTHMCQGGIFGSNPLGQGVLGSMGIVDTNEDT